MTYNTVQYNTIKQFYCPVIKPIRNLMKHEMTGWQWHWLDHMQSFATRNRQIITLAPHHSATHHSMFTGRMLFPMPNQQC